MVCYVSDAFVGSSAVQCPCALRKLAMQNEEEPDEQPLSTPAGRGRGRGGGRGSKKTPVPEACKGTAKDPEDVVPEKAAGLDPTSSVKGKKGQGRGRGHGSKKNPMLEAVEGTDKPDPVPEACTGTDKKGAAAPEEAAGFDRSSVVKGKKGQGRGRGRGSKKNPVPEAFEGTEKPDPVPQACVAMGSGGPAVERSSPLKKKARASKAPECDAGHSGGTPCKPKRRPRVSKGDTSAPAATPEKPATKKYRNCKDDQGSGCMVIHNTRKLGTILAPFHLQFFLPKPVHVCLYSN